MTWSLELSDSGEQTHTACRYPVGMGCEGWQVGSHVRWLPTGETGYIRRIAGDRAYVGFGGPSRWVDCAELQSASEEPDEILLDGQLGDGRLYGLRLQARYLHHARKHDPLAGLSSARIEPQLHQVYVAHRVVSKLRPRMILADEVGLGKTIEAGLILKELAARGLVERVLIVVPASLQFQWQHELRSKFNEDFEVIDGDAARFLGRTGGNPWAKRDKIICSLTLAANRRHAENIAAVPWDMVVFDEAHKVRRSKQGNRVSTTLAYELADELKETTTGLLLLTATPMQLHPFELHALIELVEPGLYSYDEYERRRKELPRLNDLMKMVRGWRAKTAEEKALDLERHGRELSVMTDVAEADLSSRLDDETFREQVMDTLAEEHPLVQVLVRNRKAEIGGFTQRKPVRILVDLGPEEADVYEDVTEYTRRGWRQAKQEKRNAVGFLMVLYQKMLTSSSTAIRASFQRRVEKLEAQLKDTREQRQSVVAPDVDRLEELEDAVELATAVEELESLAIDEANLEAEIAELERLIERLGRIRDSKARELIKGIRKILDRDPDEKVLVFTQYIDTQRFLQHALEANGIRTTIFNGQLRPDEKEKAVAAFRGSASVLISTEAGGEGRNFQFCHIMFNYDLPWNPMKVEQRIGRLDRIGQKHDVAIYNLAYDDTVELRVLDVLENRIRLFEESVGSLDPILGTIERDIERIVFERFERMDEAFDELAVSVERAVQQAREKEKVMADFILDRASLRRDVANELLGRRPMATHEDLRRFVADVLKTFGGRLDQDTDGSWLIQLSPRLTTRLRTRQSVTRGEFDWKRALEREDDAFFAFGHELIDAIVRLPLDSQVVAAARQVDDLSGGPYVEVVYELEAEGLARSGKFVRHLVAENLSVTSEILERMPELGYDLPDAEIPKWAPEALEASRRAIDALWQEEAVRIAEEHRRLQEEELERLRRLYAYRRERLERIISEEEEWIAEKEESGTDRDRRILPARKGKLAKNRERLARLEAEYQRELARIQKQGSGVAVTTVAAGLVVGA